MEGCAIEKLFGKSVPVSSTKHLTGHTLGAASIVEAYICNLILQHNLELPYHKYDETEYVEEFGGINLITKNNQKLNKKQDLYLILNSVKK